MNVKYIFVTLILFSIEVLIALFINDSFIRPFLGDVLVVILIFSFCRIFYSGNRLTLTISVLIFSFLVEFSQYFKLVEVLRLENFKLAKIILGATFDFMDLIAYTLGAFISYFLDKRINQ